MARDGAQWRVLARHAALSAAGLCRGESWLFSSPHGLSDACRLVASRLPASPQLYRTEPCHVIAPRFIYRRCHSLAVLSPSRRFSDLLLPFFDSPSGSIPYLLPGGRFPAVLCPCRLLRSDSCQIRSFSLCIVTLPCHCPARRICVAPCQGNSYLPIPLLSISARAISCRLAAMPFLFFSLRRPASCLHSPPCPCASSRVHSLPYRHRSCRCAAAPYRIIDTHSFAAAHPLLVLRYHSVPCLSASCQLIDDLRTAGSEQSPAGQFSALTIHVTLHRIRSPPRLSKATPLRSPPSRTISNPLISSARQLICRLRRSWPCRLCAVMLMAHRFRSATLFFGSVQFQCRSFQHASHQNQCVSAHLTACLIYSLPVPFGAFRLRSPRCRICSLTLLSQLLHATAMPIESNRFSSVANLFSTSQGRLASCLHGSMPYRVRSGPVPASQIHGHSTHSKSWLITASSSHFGSLPSFSIPYLSLASPRFSIADCITVVRLIAISSPL